MLPIPQINEDTRPYFEAAAADQLKLQRCTGCQALQAIPRTFCAHCQCAQLEWIPATGRGKVASFSIVHRGPTKAFKEISPYVLALIDLEEGVRLMLNILGEDREQVAIGDPVEIIFESRGDEGFKLPQARRKI
ncbi:MAG: putative OB-fold protein [Gammaproteobacteria bacterium]|jgi:uncharacterized OB-fold protein